MITYWQQDDGQFFKTKKEEINSKKPLWIDARNVTRDETNLLQEEYELEQDHILDILDPDELSRMEDGEGYIIRLHETDNGKAKASIKFGYKVKKAWSCDLMENVSKELPVISDNEVAIEIRPFEIFTVKTAILK